MGGLAAQAGWLGPKVGSHLAPFLYISHEVEPSELSQCLCYDDSTRNIVVIIIIVIVIQCFDTAGLLMYLLIA